MHVSSSLSVSRALNGGGVQSERIYREKGKKAEAGDRYAPSDRCTGTYGIWTCDIRSGDAGVFSDKTGKFIRAGRRIYALMTVLKGVAEVEMLCLNSRESFEENKLFLRRRMEEEQNPVVRSLLEKDQKHLDRIQVQMATAREFLIIVRLKEEEEREALAYLSRIEKSLKEQGFSVSSAGREDIKRLLAVYYEQNVTTEKFEDFDGERWIIQED